MFMYEWGRRLGQHRRELRSSLRRLPDDFRESGFAVWVREILAFCFCCVLV